METQICECPNYEKTQTGWDCPRCGYVTQPTEMMERKMSEHTEQAALFDWARRLEVSIPELRMLYAIPNGGHRHAAVGAKLKAEGVKAGVLDINLDIAIAPHHGLRIEMKHGKNKMQSTQIDWMDRYLTYGYDVVVCYDWQSAAKYILDYLRLDREGRI